MALLMATQMTFDRKMAAINLSFVQYAQAIRIGALNVQFIGQQAFRLSNHHIATFGTIFPCRRVMNPEIE